MARGTPRLTATKFWVLGSDCYGHGMVLGPCGGCRESQRPALREFPVEGGGGVGMGV